MSSKGFTKRSALSVFSESDRLHALIDIVPDAMVVIDGKGQILSFSRGAERMFGYSEEELAGENVSMLMPSPDRERHDGYIEHYLETGERRVIGIGRVTTARSRDGITFPIDLSIGEFEIDGDRAFAGFIRDLTDRRESERQVQSLQAELSHVNRISSLGTLATSIAHELNQPLTAIANYANAAADLLDDAAAENLANVREALGECAKEAIRAGQIVQRLRDFISRGETNREFASLAKIVQESTALSLIDGDGRGVDLETRLDRDADRVMVDPIQIQQVLVNLVRNALEAMRESPCKQLRISSEAGPGSTVVVTVCDSGPGLDAHVAERLFHPFISTKASGMGLGLSICHTIITSHGGKIWAEPSEMGGTQFHFTLPTGEVGDEDE